MAKADVSARRCVLVVEDQDDLRAMLRTYLEHEGHEVLEARDGPSAVRTAVERRPDSVLIDIGIPGFDGYEVARQVRAACGGAIRLIALTGRGEADDRAKASAAGFDHHLVKPVLPARLAATLI